MTNDFTPSEKADVIEDFITSVMGKSRVVTIRSGKCMTCDVGLLCRTCNKEVHHHIMGTNHQFTPFRDRFSVEEYYISGMCQSCQDSVFDMEDY